MTRVNGAKTKRIHVQPGQEVIIDWLVTWESTNIEISHEVSKVIDSTAKRLPLESEQDVMGEETSK